MPSLQVASSAPSVGLVSRGPFVEHSIAYDDATLDYNDSATQYDGAGAVTTERYSMPNTSITNPTAAVTINTQQGGIPHAGIQSTAPRVRIYAD